jgi:hypothetical protein
MEDRRSTPSGFDVVHAFQSQGRDRLHGGCPRLIPNVCSTLPLSQDCNTTTYQGLGEELTVDVDEGITRSGGALHGQAAAI